MKMAAAEALWNSEDPASFSIFTIGNEQQRKDVFAIRIPDLLSIMAYNEAGGTVQGIKNLQAAYQQKYGALPHGRILPGKGACLMDNLTLSRWNSSMDLFGEIS
jgi:cytochrome bd-type quinol oxidase subunit 1